MATKKEITKVDFEAAFSELNQIVEQIEHSELSLEDALKKFERGIHLIRSCQTTLKAAEQKVQILMEQNGETKLASFNAGSDDSDNS